MEGAREVEVAQHLTLAKGASPSHTYIYEDYQVFVCELLCICPMHAYHPRSHVPSSAGAMAVTHRNASVQVPDSDYDEEND